MNGRLTVFLSVLTFSPPETSPNGLQRVFHLMSILNESPGLPERIRAYRPGERAR